MTLNRLLVPSDFSASSDHALQIAASLARGAQTHIMLLHVAQSPAAFVAPYPMPVVDLPPSVEHVERESQHMLERQAARWIPADVPWSAKVVMGVAEQEIAAEVVRGGHDLVLMGTHGRTGLRHLLLGSVAEHVLRHCAVPVLVTR